MTFSVGNNVSDVNAMYILFYLITLNNGVYLSEVETHASFKQLTFAHKMKQNVFYYHCVVQRNQMAHQEVFCRVTLFCH